MRRLVPSHAGLVAGRSACLPGQSSRGAGAGWVRGVWGGRRGGVWVRWAPARADLTTAGRAGCGGPQHARTSPRPAVRGACGGPQHAQTSPRPATRGCGGECNRQDRRFCPGAHPRVAVWRKTVGFVDLAAEAGTPPGASPASNGPPPKHRGTRRSLETTRLSAGAAERPRGAARPPSGPGPSGRPTSSASRAGRLAAVPHRVTSPG